MSISRLLRLTIIACISISSCAYATILPIQTWTTQGGTRVFFVKTNELPLLDIAVVFDAGSRRDGNQAGLASMTGNMLDEGSKNLNADQIAAGFSNTGAIYGASTNQDMTIINLRTLTKPELLQPSLALFNQVLSQPTFPINAFQRQQQITLNAIRSQQQSPDTIATLTFFNKLYDNHPYGHPVIGTMDTVNKLTINDVQNFYKRYFVKQNAIVAIVGNIDRPTANQIVDQVLANLPGGQKAMPLVTPPLAKTQTTMVPYPATQDYVRIGTLGINREEPNYFPFVVGNYILGGGMVSRLFDQVREKQGLTYGIGSYLMPLANHGPFVIALQSRNSEANRAIQITNSVLQSFIQQGPNPQELQAAKNYLTGNYPTQFASNSDILSHLIILGFYQLPLNYLDTFTSKIQAVTSSQIQTTFQQQVQPEHLVTVIVGKQQT